MGKILVLLSSSGVSPLLSERFTSGVGECVHQKLVPPLDLNPCPLSGCLPVQSLVRFDKIVMNPISLCERRFVRLPSSLHFDTLAESAVEPFDAIIVRVRPLLVLKARVGNQLRFLLSIPKDQIESALV